MAFTLTPELTFLLSVLIFWIVLYVLARIFHLEKYGLDVKPGYFMYKSKALNSLLDRLANRNHFLWLVLSNIGVAFSVGLMAFSIYFFSNNLLRFFLPIGTVSPIYPVIPVLTIRLYWLPYLFFAIAVIIVSHELMHGVIARLEGMPVLSTGILAYLIIPGAFVEPDEKEFEKARLLSKLRVLAVGSSTNLVVGLLVFLLIMGLFTAPAGVLIYGVTSDGPLARSGAPVQQWDVIQAINGTPVNTYTQYSNLTRNLAPNVTVTVTILHANQKENITVVTVPNPSNRSRGLIGFEAGFIPVYYPTRLGLDQYVNVNMYLGLFWTYLIGISVAITNMLPAFPFDGEKLLYYPLASLVKKRQRELRLLINGLAWGLFALNVALSFLIFGARPI